jgi:hypothetical protein
MSIEVMKQALEAFERGTTGLAIRVIPALRQAIEQAEKQEPVAWMSQGGDVSRSKKYFEEMGFNSVIPLYAAPFNWVGIAVDEIPSLWGNADADLWLFAKAIEDKLKEKNT